MAPLYRSDKENFFWYNANLVLSICMCGSEQIICNCGVVVAFDDDFNKGIVVLEVGQFPTAVVEPRVCYAE